MKFYLSSGVSSMTGKVDVPDIMEGPKGSGISTVIVLDIIYRFLNLPNTKAEYIHIHTHTLVDYYTGQH